MYLIFKWFCRDGLHVNANAQNRANWMIRTPVDGLTTSPSPGPITGLNEEVWDDPVSPHGKRIKLESRTAVFPVRREWISTGGI